MIGIIIDTSLIIIINIIIIVLLFFVSSTPSILLVVVLVVVFFFCGVCGSLTIARTTKTNRPAPAYATPLKGLRDAQPGQLKDDCEVEKVTVEACYPDRRAVVWGKRTFDHCEGFRSGPRPLLERSSLAPCRYTTGSKVMSPSIPSRWRVGRCAC